MHRKRRCSRPVADLTPDRAAYMIGVEWLHRTGPPWSSRPAPSWTAARPDSGAGRGCGRPAEKPG